MNYRKFGFISIISFLLVFNLYFTFNNTCNVVIASQPVIAKKADSENKSVKQVEDKKQESKDIDRADNKADSSKESFFSKLLKFVLIGVGIVFAIYLLKLFKKLILGSKVKTKKTQPETIIYEKDPETVTEAVCSFVKHKIKY